MSGEVVKDLFLIAKQRELSGNNQNKYSKVQPANLIRFCLKVLDSALILVPYPCSYN